MSWKIFDSSYLEYDEWFDNKGKTTFEKELKALQFAISKVKPKSIEIGVGTGRFAQLLNINFGIEPSLNMARLSRSRGVKVIASKGENLPIKDNVFAEVYYIFSVCFLDDLEKSLKESYRILNSEGSLIIGFIPSNSPLGEKYIEKKKKGHPYYKNSDFYTYEDLIKIIEKNNFKIEKTISQTLLGNINITYKGFNPLSSFIIIVSNKK